MPSVLSQALSNLQQTAEDYAKNREEAQKLQDAAAGNRQILNTLVQQGIWGDKEIIEYNKKNDRGRNDMIASGARAWLFKSQVEDQQLQRDAAKRAAETLTIQQAQEARAKAQYEYQPGADVYNAAAASNLNVIPTGPGQPIHLAPYAKTGPTEAQLAQAQEEAKKVGGHYVPDPTTGGYRFEKFPTPGAETIEIAPGVNVPRTSPEAQAFIAESNPQTRIHQEFGAKPEDFLPRNVEVGAQLGKDFGNKFVTDPKYGQSHVRLKNTGTIMDMGKYSKYLRQLADAGQIDEAVKHPLTGQTITPAKRQAAVGVPGELDYTNPTHVALVQDAIKRNGGDVIAAQAELRQKGWKF
jgi:hypothetical protein